MKKAILLVFLVMALLIAPASATKTPQNIMEPLSCEKSIFTAVNIYTHGIEKTINIPVDNLLISSNAGPKKDKHVRFTLLC